MHGEEKICGSSREGTSSVGGRGGESRRDEVRDKTERFGIIHPLDRSKRVRSSQHDWENNVI